MISLKNNAQSVLTLPVSAAQTLLNLSLGDGAKFPDLSLGDSFRCAIRDSAGNLEYVRVVQRAGDILTVERGQEGTRALDWKTGARVQLRMTAKTWEDMAGEHWKRVTDASGTPLIPTVVNQSSFWLPGNFVSLFEQTRSFRLYTGEGTFLYGYVASSSLSGNATLVAVEGVNLPTTVIAVDVGLPLNVHPKAINATPVAHLTDPSAHSAIIVPLRGDINEIKEILSGLVRSDGTIDASMLPPATKKTLGGVIIGKGLKINDVGLAEVDETVFAKVPSSVNADLAWAANRLRREGGVDTVWYWAGQGGQPAYLWGSNDGTNMYVYNPSNFSVNYANSAGWAGGSGAVSNIGAARVSGVVSRCGDEICVHAPAGGQYEIFYSQQVAVTSGRFPQSELHATLNPGVYAGGSFLGKTENMKHDDAHMVGNAGILYRI